MDTIELLSRNSFIPWVSLVACWARCQILDKWVDKTETVLPSRGGSGWEVNLSQLSTDLASVLRSWAARSRLSPSSGGPSTGSHCICWLFPVVPSGGRGSGLCLGSVLTLLITRPPPPYHFGLCNSCLLPRLHLNLSLRCGTCVTNENHQ